MLLLSLLISVWCLLLLFLLLSVAVVPNRYHFFRKQSELLFNMNQPTVMPNPVLQRCFAMPESGCQATGPWRRANVMWTLIQAALRVPHSRDTKYWYPLDIHHGKINYDSQKIWRFLPNLFSHQLHHSLCRQVRSARGGGRWWGVTRRHSLSLTLT